MSDPARTADILQFSVGDGFFEHFDLANRLRDHETGVSHQGDTGGVISAIFQTL
jgi:hypothetical protein